MPFLSIRLGTLVQNAALFIYLLTIGNRSSIIVNIITNPSIHPYSKINRCFDESASKEKTPTKKEQKEKKRKESSIKREKKTYRYEFKSVMKYK